MIIGVLIGVVLVALLVYWSMTRDNGDYDDIDWDN